MEDKRGLYKKIKLFGYASFIPLMLIAGPLSGYYFGTFLDEKFHFGMNAVMISVLLGFGAGVLEVARIIKRLLSMLKN